MKCQEAILDEGESTNLHFHRPKHKLESRQMSYIDLNRYQFGGICISFGPNHSGIKTCDLWYAVTQNSD